LLATLLGDADPACVPMVGRDAATAVVSALRRRGGL